MVWASIYPTSQNDFASLTQALGRLKLTDAAFSFEEESSGSLGRGYRCGFLGMLHLEIITERLRREYNLSLTVAAPSISYELVNEKTGEREIIYTPHRFPDDLKGRQVYEPWVKAQVLTPLEYSSVLLKLFREHEARVLATELWGIDRASFAITLPLRELMRRFFDELKSVSSGFASLTYELAGLEIADVVRLDVLVAEESVPAFTRIVPRFRLEAEAREVVRRLAELLPRQLFTLKIQAGAGGRILASRSLPALKKDVTGYLYGGDITRKRKLWEKQKRGKKRLLARGQVTIPPEVFLKMVSGSGEE
jgi:GTP-binding protein LepA